MTDPARFSITIGREVVRHLIAAAAATPDREVCGLLLGETGSVAAAIPAANVAADPAHAFEIDPATLIAAHRAARAGGPAVIGCYHSHPSGEAAPSETDRAASEPGTVWIIVAGDRARAWLRGEEGFEEVLMLTTPSC